ncbi:hypothetical protein V3330_11335 [Wenzhouxiangellaceae bacterium CH-27]|uniref:Glycosyltransferase 2-like domain-containing protein n=1 Tax=Elongatibacter sediminis TaxID=3119006 RepID=A0AAW9RGU9_9GAMM
MAFRAIARAGMSARAYRKRLYTGHRKRMKTVSLAPLFEPAIRMTSVLTPQTRQELIEAGSARMGASSVAICGLARDCANSLSRLIPAIEALAACFPEHRIIVVENDSLDDTAHVLNTWGSKNPAVETIHFSYVGDQCADPGSGGWFGHNRIARMTFARNRYLEAVKEPAPAEFMIVVDLDIWTFDLDGVKHSFGLMDDWDAIAGDGRRYSLRHPWRPSVYWDSYAYEPATGFDEDVQTPEQIRTDQVEIARQLNRGELLPARCAFGGLCIYRTERLIGHAYGLIENAHPDVTVLCEHHTLVRSVRADHSDFRLAINPAMRVRYASARKLIGQATRRFILRR